MTEIDKMLGRLSEVLQSAADVLAPPPTALQDFDYHYKLVKNFYVADKTLPKIHINDTNIPVHLEQMLHILIREEQEINAALRKTNSVDPAQSDSGESSSSNGSKTDEFPVAECMEFVLNNRPLDILVELATGDTPPGARLVILNWIRRLLSCMKDPPLSHASLFQPVQKLVELCNGTIASPYEREEILFLETVAGLVRKDPIMANLFLKSHHHSAQMLASWKGLSVTKTPVNNPLFESAKIEYDSRRISLVKDEKSGENNGDELGASSAVVIPNLTEERVAKAKCDCDDEEHFVLFDAIVSYLDSADSTIIVRACEGILILASLPTLNKSCNAVRNSLSRFSTMMADRLSVHCQQIPEDMDTGDIEDANVSWGLIPRDSEQPHFVGRYQLTSFLCWLDYCDCLMKESPTVAPELGELIRSQLLISYIEPGLLGSYAPFMLVLTAKIIKKTQSRALLDEIANWLIGESDITEINGTDCLLTILIENAHENSDILLQTLQFVESLLDNPHEKILHGMIFFYINNRGYCDSNKQTIQSWSDEEDNRERRRGSAEDPIKSRTLAPNNILKVINHFLLLLPRHIMNDAAGICYEEYMQDASRHYQTWINKTRGFQWPVEAVWPVSPNRSPSSEGTTLDTFPTAKPKTKSKSELNDVQCGDSGISEESFYEGPLLKLLFSHIKQMNTQAYELNLAVIAILSKLALFPHPYLHEILLSPEIPVAPGATTLWSVMQFLARQLLTEIPRVENFQERIIETGKRLLSNPPLYHKDCEHEPSPTQEEEDEINDPLFESIVVLEEFCKELAAIAFVKYHHATE